MIPEHVAVSDLPTAKVIILQQFSLMRNRFLTGRQVEKNCQWTTCNTNRNRI